MSMPIDLGHRDLGHPARGHVQTSLTGSSISPFNGNGMVIVVAGAIVRRGLRNWRFLLAYDACTHLSLRFY